jgi:predicted O-methyltransferase YrrM
VTIPGPGIERSNVGSAEVYYALGALVQHYSPKTVVEIGTFLGVGTLTICMNAPTDSKIVTVDLPDHVVGRLVGTDYHLAAIARSRCGEAFRNGPFESRITQIRQDSTKLDYVTIAPDADFVFIDGGHSYDMIRADTEIARRAMAKGGVIIWDDYWWYYPDVVRYLDEIADDMTLHLIDRTNLVVGSVS